MIHVVLADKATSETQARALLAADPEGNPDAVYHGLWVIPKPAAVRVHVFGATTPEELTAAHWTREDA